MGSPATEGDCLCNRPAGVTFIEVMGQRIGLSGTEELFSRWAAEGRKPEELEAGEILSGLRERNYVSRSVERHYVEAVRAAYARRLRRAEKAAADAQG